MRPTISTRVSSAETSTLYWYSTIVLQKITEKIYYVIGGKHFPEKKVHKALGLKAAPIYCSKPFTGHVNLFVGENPPAWSKKPPVVVYEAKITFVSDNSMIIKTHSEMVSKHAWE